jgi:hypothetical protein
VIIALEAVAASPRRPAVATLSGNSPVWSDALNEAIYRLTDAGVPVVNGAGSDGYDATGTLFGNLEGSITVAGTDKVNNSVATSTVSSFKSYPHSLSITYQQILKLKLKRNERSSGVIIFLPPIC